MSYTQIYFHINYSTKGRSPALAKEKRKQIFGYLWGILKKKQCRLYRINGGDDHIHMLTSLHPTLDLASLVRELKTSSTAWIKRENVVPTFPGWQDQYAAFTKSHEDVPKVIEYIKNQEEHHRKVSFIEEFKALLREEGIDFDERYLQ